ncbi:MAG TPA: lipid A deacylase LpxR family protein [Stellaceae bacterium]|nr:lipid A deacylase LpxR family protein [Stellaceae bacterium]
MTKTRAAAWLLAAASLGVSPVQAQEAAAQGQIVQAPVPLAAPAAAKGELSFIEENDSLFSKSDKHYTQGARADYLSVPLGPGWRSDVFDFLGPLFPGPTDRQRRFDWIALGQSIYTPMNLKLNPPSSADRPYAGWLYTGGEFLQENGGNSLTGFEVLLGVVGPAAMGRQVQNDWHQFVIGIPGGAGWNDQLKNEPGLAISYDKHWRLGIVKFGGIGVDFVPEANVTVGNVFTYGAVGGIIRIGDSLDTDYGPPRIRPGPSGTDWVDGRRRNGNFGYYFFAGGEGRAMAQNIFLDGNTYVHSRSVSKKPLVGDLTAGVEMFWKDDFRVDLGLLSRTKEFYGQQGQDSYAGFRFTFGL